MTITKQITDYGLLAELAYLKLEDIEILDNQKKILVKILLKKNF